MHTYKLGRILSAGQERGVIATATHHIDIGLALADERLSDVQAVLNRWFELEPRLAAIAEDPPHKAILEGDIDLLAPLAPRSIICAGANYKDHLLEMLAARGVDVSNWSRNPEARPWFFLKSIGCVAAPGQDVSISSFDWNIDWEVELAAVIGRTTRRATPSNALDNVAGYTVANDLSARGRLKRSDAADGSPFVFDWVGHKVFDGSCPLGPWMLPASQVPDPQNMRLGLSVNGETMQDSNTSDMIFSLAEQIAEISATLTLQPGDIILTGTPAGVGSGRGQFLKDGDLVEATIYGIGTLKNRVVLAEDQAIA